MRITKEQLKRIIKEELAMNEAEAKLHPLAGAIAGLAVAAAAVLSGPALPATALAGAGMATLIQNHVGKRLSQVYADVDIGDEDALVKLLVNAVNLAAEAATAANKEESADPQKALEAVKANKDKMNELIKAVAKDVSDRSKSVCRTAGKEASVLGIKCFTFTYESDELQTALDQADLGKYLMAFETALKANGLKVSSGLGRKIGQAVGLAKEVKVKRSLRHKAGIPLATIIGGAVGGAAGAVAGNVPGAVAGGLAGAGAGTAAGTKLNTRYDKYLLRKVATENDIVAAAIAHKEEAEETGADWDVEAWMEEVLSGLTEKQRGYIVYEEEEFLKAGRVYGDVELADELASHFQKQGLLDAEGIESIPSTEPVQIEKGYDRPATQGECLLLLVF